LKAKRARYQQGTIRKIARANGFAWEVRFSETINGKQRQKSLYFQSDEYPTKASVRKATQLQVALANSDNDRHKVGVNFGTITALYRSAHLPTLRKATRDKNAYLLKDFIEPEWSNVPLLSLTPLKVVGWLTGIKGTKNPLKPLAATTRAGIRSVMHQCFELAALHGYLPATDRNPMSLVKIKGTSQREREKIILQPEQFNRLVTALPVPLNVMVLLLGCLGLRISELLGLHWGDIDWDNFTIMIQRGFSHEELGEVKTQASRAKLPLDEALLGIIKTYRATAADSELMFPSSRTGRYRSASMLLQKGMQPVAIRLGFGRVTFHDLRHSCRTWLDAKGVPVGVVKDMLRHADYSTTMNVYGGALQPDMRIGQSAMVRELIPESMKH
jgi:integrase